MVSDLSLNLTQLSLQVPLPFFARKMKMIVRPRYGFLAFQHAGEGRAPSDIQRDDRITAPVIDS